jgi:hypothetical protein
MNEFLTNNSNRTGKAGILTSIGQNKNLTVFRIINLEMYKGNLSRGFNKDNHREFNSRKDNLSRGFSNRKDKSKDLRLSNRNTLSLEENLKDGRRNIEGKTKVNAPTKRRS